MHKMRYKPLHTFFILLVATLFPLNAWAISSLGCSAAVLGELFIPGAGYVFLGDYDKAIVFGGARWMTGLKAYEYSQSSDYEKDPDKIYKITPVQDDTDKVDVFLSRETFYANTYNSISSNLALITFYDLYDGGCQNNSKTYSEIFSPFQFYKFGGDWTFWAPTSYIALTPDVGSNVTYHVDSDLTREEMRRASFVQYQLVGVGEEMLFRGVIQRSLYKMFSGWLSQGVARWSSIVTASAIFGAAHSGQGFSASSGTAFAMGMYLGWIYHPAEGDFDLNQAIAVHSWWDVILTDRMLRGSSFVERQSGENAQNTTARAGRTIPLFAFSYRF